MDTSKKIWTIEMVLEAIKIPYDAYVTEHFTWKEVLVNQTQRPSERVLRNLQVISKKLEVLRSSVFKNKPITITSGWRSASYNQSIKGAKSSYHIDGMALDFVVEDFTPQEVQEILDPIWNGGLEYAPTWTHIDSRPYKVRFDDKGRKYPSGKYSK